MGVRSHTCGRYGFVRWASMSWPSYFKSLIFLVKHLSNFPSWFLLFPTYLSDLLILLTLCWYLVMSKVPLCPKDFWLTPLDSFWWDIYTGANDMSRLGDLYYPGWKSSIIYQRIYYPMWSKVWSVMSSVLQVALVKGVLCFWDVLSFLDYVSCLESYRIFCPKCLMIWSWWVLGIMWRI